jgi:hypothetical protein
MLSQRLCTPHRPASSCPAIAVRARGQTSSNHQQSILIKRLSSNTGSVLKPAIALSYSSSSSSRSSSSIICSASSHGPNPTSSKLKRSVWTAVDVIALLGSVGGALAALLGLVAPTYALVLPLVLPVVSLIAALQREDLSNEVRPVKQQDCSSPPAAVFAAVVTIGYKCLRRHTW